MGGEGALALQRCATDTDLGSSSLSKSPRSRRAKSVTVANVGSSSRPPRKRRSKEKVEISLDNVLPKSPSKRKSKFKANGGSNRSLNKESTIPEDESCVPEESPDIVWGDDANNNNKRDNGEGSSSTATTLDSSFGSLDSSGGGRRRRRKEKPDMDWGSHAKNNSGHNKKKDIGSGHHKKKDALRGGSGHHQRVSTTKPKAGMRKSLSSSNLRMGTNDLSKSPKKPAAAATKMGAMSPLLQIMAMDASYHKSPKKPSAASNHNKNVSKQSLEDGLKSFEEMVKRVRMHDDAGASSSEEEEEEFAEEQEEEEEDDASDDSEEDEKKHRRVPKSQRKKAGRVRSKGDGNRKSNKSSSRRPKRSQTMDDASSRRRNHHQQGPNTPKSGRKARAQSMIVRSPLSDDQDEVREKRRERSRRGQRMSIAEETGLVTPRRQSRRSLVIKNSADAARRPSRQPALPTSLDLGYDDEDHEAPKHRRREGRRASMGSGIDRSERKEGSRRGQRSTAGLSNTLHGLVTPRRTSRKLAVPSPFELDDESDPLHTDEDSALSINHQKDHGRQPPKAAAERPRPSRESLLVFDDGDDEEEDAMSASQSSARTRRGTRPAAQDPMNMSRRRRDVSSRRGSAMTRGDDMDSSSAADPMDLSSRRRAGSRRSLMDNSAAGRRRLQSLRGLDKLDDDEGNDGSSKDHEEDAGSIGVKSVPDLGRNSMRGRRRDAVDDAAVGRRSSSTSRTGRYGYGGDEQRLTLSAVPSTPKKSVGLAALLYCKPLDLANDEDKDDDGKSSAGGDDESRDSSSGSPVSVADVDGEKPEVDKAKAKKDYWKAKLAEGKSEGSSRGQRSVLLP